MSQFSTSFLFIELNMGMELNTTHAPAMVRCSFHAISAMFSLICSGSGTPIRATGTIVEMRYLPVVANALTRTRDRASSLASSSPLLSLSSLSNSASMNFIHSCFVIFPCSLGAIRSIKRLTSSSASARLSSPLGTADFCGTAVLRMAASASDVATASVIDATLAFFNIISDYQPGGRDKQYETGPEQVLRVSLESHKVNR